MQGFSRATLKFQLGFTRFLFIWPHLWQDYNFHTNINFFFLVQHLRNATSGLLLRMARHPVAWSIHATHYNFVWEVNSLLNPQVKPSTFGF